MAKKKTKAVAAEAAKPVEETLLKFPVETLLRLKLAKQEGETASRDFKLANMQKKLILAQIDPKGLLAAEEAKIQKAKVSFDAAGHAYKTALTSACAALGLPIEKVAFDLETGVITIAEK